MLDDKFLFSFNNCIQTTFNHFVCAGMFPIEETRFWLISDSRNLLFIKFEVVRHIWMSVTDVLSVCERGMISNVLIYVQVHILGIQIFKGDVAELNTFCVYIYLKPTKHKLLDWRKRFKNQ